MFWQIPFFPLVKKDLTFIHLGNDSMVEDLVNFEKLRMIAKEVRRICSMAPVCCVSLPLEIHVLSLYKRNCSLVAFPWNDFMLYYNTVKKC